MNTSKIMLAAAMAMSTASAMAQKSFRLTGLLPGTADGVKVYLSKADSHTPFDSTVISGNKFELKGASPLAFADHYRITVDLQPGNYRAAHAVNFFMGNEQVNIAVPHIDSMPGYYYGTGGHVRNVTICGARQQALYEAFMEETAGLSARNGALHEQYLAVYHRPAAEGVFNTKEGMELVRKMDKLADTIRDRRIAFIKAHPASVVSANLMGYIMYGASGKYTEQEIESFMALLNPSLANAPIMQAIYKAKETALATAKGKRFIDIELKDANGRNVRLSSFVKPGQLNMLEFWASWCGPCRAEIPHLKYLAGHIENNDFNMVSISIDEKKADWDKAMKAEKMGWAQLCDMKGFDGPVAEKYRVFGIPFSVVLDGDGKIVATGVRGAELDVLLEDLLGDKIKAF